MARKRLWVRFLAGGALALVVTGASVAGWWLPVRRIHETVRAYTEALVSGNKTMLAGVALGNAALKLSTAGDSDPGVAQVHRLRVHNVSVHGRLAEATVLVELTHPVSAQDSLPLFFAERLSNQDGEWKVVAIEPVDPPAREHWWSAMLPAAPAELDGITATVHRFLQATAVGDLATGARYLGGRAWLSGEATRQQMAGKPLVAGGKVEDVMVTVVDWAPPVAIARVEYALSDGKRVQWLAQLYRVAEEGGHDSPWRILRIDPL